MSKSKTINAVPRAFAGGQVEFEMTDERADLIEKVADAGSNLPRLISLMGETNANRYMRLRCGGVYTRDAVIKGMLWI